MIYSGSLRDIEPSLELLGEASPWIASQGYIGHVVQEGSRWPTLLFHRRGEGVKRYGLSQASARSILDAPVCTPWTLDWPGLCELLLSLKRFDDVALMGHKEWHQSELDAHIPSAYFLEGLARALPTLLASGALGHQDVFEQIQRLVFFAEGFAQSATLSTLDSRFLGMLGDSVPAQPAAEIEHLGWLCCAAKISEPPAGADLSLALMCEVSSGLAALPPLQLRRLEVLGPSLDGLRKIVHIGTRKPIAPTWVQVARELPGEPWFVSIDRQTPCAPSEIKRFFTWFVPYVRDNQYGEVDTRFVGTYLADGADLPALIFARASGDMIWVEPSWDQLDAKLWTGPGD